MTKPCRGVNCRRARPSESSNSPRPPRPRNKAYSRGTNAIQQRKYRLGLGKITICRPAESRAKSKALGGILSTFEILAKLLSPAESSFEKPPRIAGFEHYLELISFESPWSQGTIAAAVFSLCQRAHACLRRMPRLPLPVIRLVRKKTDIQGKTRDNAGALDPQHLQLIRMDIRKA